MRIGEGSQLERREMTCNEREFNLGFTKQSATNTFDLNSNHSFHGDHPCGVLRPLFFCSVLCSLQIFPHSPRKNPPRNPAPAISASPSTAPPAPSTPSPTFP